MLTDKKRKTALFITAVLMNLLFFFISYFTNLPLWLDTTGTIYISIILGYQFGICVGLINSVISALFFYGYQSIIFYLVSFAVAIIADNIYRKTNKRFRWVLMFAALSFAGGFCAATLTLIFDKGVPADYWTRELYFYLLKLKLFPVLGTTVSIFAIKTLDTLMSLFLAGLLLKLTPKRIKTNEYVIKT